MKKKQGRPREKNPTPVTVFTVRMPTAKYQELVASRPASGVFSTNKFLQRLLEIGLQETRSNPPRLFSGIDLTQTPTEPVNIK